MSHNNIRSRVDFSQPKCIGRLKSTLPAKIRGEILDIEIGSQLRKCIPIFHPSYLLRYHSLEEGSPRDLMLKDLIKVHDLLQ